MLRIRTLSLLAGLLGIALSGSAQAATLGVNYDMDVTYTSATGVRANTATYGTDLTGMTVSATFADGGTGTWTWGRLNTWNPYAVGLVSASADLGLTYGSNSFNLDAGRRIESMTINMVGANVIFDAGGYPDRDPRNSPTTKIGSEFDIVSGLLGLNGDIQATYSDHVIIGNYLDGEDSFASLSIDFSGLQDGGFLGALSWHSDTDVLAANGPLVPVPLPAGMGLLFAGVGAFGFARRRKLQRGRKA